MPTPASPADPTAPLRVGLVGVGTIATAVHLPLLARDPALRLSAVSDLDATRAAEVGRRYGARSLPTADLLVDPEVDAVLVATPGNHAELAVAALRAGRHVLAEKPFALTRADAEAAGALARSRQLVLQVGYMKNHDPALAVVDDWAGAIGPLRLVELAVRHPADEPQLAHLRRLPGAGLDEAARRWAVDADARDWARVRQAVGDVPDAWARLYRYVLHGSVVHEVALLRRLGLLPDAPFDLADVRAWDGSAPPTLAVSAPLGADARLLLTWSWLPDHPRYEETVRLVGTAGSLLLDVAPPYRLDTPSRVRLLAHGPDGAAEQREAVLPAAGAFQAQLERFTAAVAAVRRASGPALDRDAADAAADTAWLQRLFVALAARHGVAVTGEAALEGTAGEAARTTAEVAR